MQVWERDMENGVFVLEWVIENGCLIQRRISEYRKMLKCTYICGGFHIWGLSYVESTLICECCGLCSQHGYRTFGRNITAECWHIAAFTPKRDLSLPISCDCNVPFSPHYQTPPSKNLIYITYLSFTHSTFHHY